MNTNQDVHILFLGSIIFNGTITCETGLHIGGSDDSLKIGGIDKMVIKDPITQKPYIPGSSFKGRLRSMVERLTGELVNRGNDKIYRHECLDAFTSQKGTNGAIHCPVCRIFGATSEGGSNLNLPSHLKVWDMLIHEGNGQEWKLERKTENTLDRLSAHANPRTNERVAKGAQFQLSMQYDVEMLLNRNKRPLVGSEERFWKDLREDLKHIAEGIKLIEATYLGGNGSRGYGRINLNQTLKMRAQTTDHLTGVSDAETGEGDANAIVKIFKEFYERKKAQWENASNEPENAAGETATGETEITAGETKVDKSEDILSKSKAPGENS